MRRGIVILAMLAPAIISGEAAAAQQTELIMRVGDGWLGFSFQPERVERAGRAAERVVIQKVWTGSPAERAGLRAGDVLIRLNDEAASMSTLDRLREQLEPGDTVRLTILRSNRQRELSVTAARRPNELRVVEIDPQSVVIQARKYLDSAIANIDLPDFRIQVGPDADSLRPFVLRLDSLRNLIAQTRLEELGPLDSIGHGFQLRITGDTVFLGPAAAPPARFTPFYVAPDSVRVAGPEIEVLPYAFSIGERAIAGAELTEIGPELGDYFGVARGILTTKVAPATPAARAGLRPGDVIVQAADHEVGSIPELRRLVLRAEQGLELVILRRGERRVLRLPMRRPARPPDP